MATKSENADIAVLQTQMKSVVDGMARIEVKLDTQQANYVTRAEFKEFKSKNWFSHALAIVVTTVITGLIAYFIANIGG